MEAWPNERNHSCLTLNKFVGVGLAGFQTGRRIDRPWTQHRPPEVTQNHICVMVLAQTGQQPYIFECLRRRPKNSTLCVLLSDKRGRALAAIYDLSKARGASRRPRRPPRDPGSLPGSRPGARGGAPGCRPGARGAPRGQPRVSRCSREEPGRAYPRPRGSPV